MAWVRNNRRWAARLALMALLLQAALAFGHVHAEDLAAPAAATVSATDTPAHDQPQSPHDDCAICATIHLAGTLDLPTPVLLVTPEPRPAVWRTSAGEIFRTTRVADVRVRGPPLI